MPNGEWVVIDDAATPEVIESIKRQFEPVQRQRPGSLSAGVKGTAGLQQGKEGGERAEVQRRVQARRYTGQSLGQTNRVMDSAILGQTPRLVGAASLPFGIAKAIMKGDPSEVGREYRISRDVAKQELRDFGTENPIAAVLSDIGGGLITPISTGARGLRYGGATLRPYAPGVGRAINKAGQWVGSRGPVGQAIAAGALNAGAQSAGRSENIQDMPLDFLAGAGMGGIMGGLVGGAGHGITRGLQIASDIKPANAARTAYAKVADLLEGGRLSPGQAERQIALMDTSGNDAIVADLTPGLTAVGGNLVRNPYLQGAQDLFKRGLNRAMQRGGRFTEQVNQVAQLPRGVRDWDALAREAELKGTREQLGQTGYAPGGVMDAPITWTKELEHFFETAPKETNKALREAYDDMLLRRESPGDIFEEVGIGGEPRLKAIPNLRSLDYLKRGFDQVIGAELAKKTSAGRTKAQAISGELNKIKDMVREQHPQYGKLLDSMRDAFQKEEALEIGQKVLRRMVTEPRQVFAEFKKLRKEDQLEWRIGVVDAMLQATTKADPSRYMLSIMRNPAQRKVFRAALGDEMRLKQFERWAEREATATRTDEALAGKQSITSAILKAEEAAGGGDIADVMWHGIRGQAFGGPWGAITNMWRKLKDLSRDESRAVQEHLARILLSKGETLEEGVGAAREFTRKRTLRNRQRGVMFGKAGARPYAGITNVGGEE